MTKQRTLTELKQLFAGRTTISIAIEINGFTGFRTTLLEDLTPDEIDRLYNIHAPKVQDIEAEYNALKADLIIKQWRSNILALAEKTGIKEKGSFQKFNNWMVVSSVLKKPLNSYSIIELKDLHTQLRGVQHNNRRSAKNTMTKAWWNQADALKQYN